MSRVILIIYYSILVIAKNIIITLITAEFIGGYFYAPK